MSNVDHTQKEDTFEVGNYIVYRKRIGKGASGTIYRGYEKGSKKEVAIKEIPETNLNDIKKNIKSEIHLMKRLKHPNIVELETVVLDRIYNNVYIIMEYCPDGDFYNFQGRKPIQEIHVQKYMKQLMLGLKYLNENNIMHRDLKPQNILISKNGDLKLTDFGYAKVVSPNNMVQTFCGSPLYMAPEIIKAKGENDYTVKADLWSVGCIFYEMVTGYPPYYVSTMNDLIKKIDEGNISIPKSLNSSDELKDLLFSLLEPNPDIRISWEDFFNHKWFQKDLLTEEENKLLAFDIDPSGFTTELPSISQHRHNTQIFMSTHLTNSEKNQFKLKNKDGPYSSSATNKTSSEYFVVGTPPERALEQEKIRKMTKIIEEKVESNVIVNRNIYDIYNEYSNNNKSIDDLHIDDETFYSCNSETGKKLVKSIDNMIDNAETTSIQIPKHNKYATSYSGDHQNEWLQNNDKSDKNQYNGKDSFNFSELFDFNSLSNNQANNQANKKNKLLTESSTYQSDYYDRKIDDDFEFSTSLISTEKSLIIENSEAYVIIDHHNKMKPIMRSDQHEYRKHKVNKFIKSSYGFLKGSLDYIGSYGNSM
jgi:serine/threonine protein kinase